MSKQEKNKGIWIPLEVWQCEELTLIEKHFLCEIKSLDNNNGCFASNAKFAKFFKISPARCTQIIKSLEAKGFIKIHLEREGKQVVKRVVNILNKGSKFFKEGSKYSKEPSKYSKEGVVNILKESNTIKSNTISNTIEYNNNIPIDILNALEIYNHFIKVTGKQLEIKDPNKHSLFRRQGKYKFVNSRLSEGATVQDCKDVITMKHKEWKDKKDMKKYIRFETLFNKTKFESYIDELRGIGDNQLNGTYTPPYTIPTFDDDNQRWMYFMARYEAYKPYLAEYLINTEYRQRAIFKKDAEGLCYDLEKQNPNLAQIQV